MCSTTESKSSLSFVITSWNAGCNSPDKEILTRWLSTFGNPDIMVIGMQGLPNEYCSDKWEYAIIHILKALPKRRYSSVGSSFQNGLYVGVFMDEPLILMRVVSELKFIKNKKKIQKRKETIVGMLQLCNISVMLINCNFDNKIGNAGLRLKQLKSAFSEAVRKFDAVLSQSDRRSVCIWCP